MQAILEVTRTSPACIFAAVEWINSRIKDLLQARDGGSYSALARHLGITPQAVQQWFDPDPERRTSPRGKRLDQIASYFGISARELQFPNEAREPDSLYASYSILGNVGPAPDVAGDVPLISWVTAGTWNPAESPYTMSDVQRIPCSKRHSPGSYALRVEGDSMTSPFGISYPDGCIIFVDPEKLSPTNGQHIIAKLVGEDNVTFKAFVRDAGRLFLKALNPGYPIIVDEFRVLGTVIGKWEDAP